MQAQPFTFSSPTVFGWIILLVVGLVLWRSINQRRGLGVVFAVCGVLFAAGLAIYFARQMDSTRVVVVSESAAVAFTPQGISAIETDTDEPNPSWVGQPPQTINGVRVFTVTAGPHATEELCEKELTQALRQGVDEFVDNFIGEPGASRRVQLEMTYIRDHLLREQHFETVQASFGPMKNLHARVMIDRSAQDLIRQRYQEALVQARLGYAGGAFALLLVLLGTAYGYLRLDTATRGYYSGRLKVAATAVILTAAAATALVVRQADPAAQWPVGFPVRESPRLVDF